MTPVSITRTRPSKPAFMRSAHQCAPLREVPTRTPHELGERLDLEPRVAKRLLEEWRFAGVVERVEPGRYRLTPGGLGIARCLADGRHEGAVELDVEDERTLLEEHPELEELQRRPARCQECGAELKPSIVQRRGKFCGRRCRQGAFRRRKAQRGLGQIDAAVAPHGVNRRFQELRVPVTPPPLADVHPNTRAAWRRLGAIPDDEAAARERAQGDDAARQGDGWSPVPSRTESVSQHYSQSHPRRAA